MEKGRILAVAKREYGQFGLRYLSLLNYGTKILKEEAKMLSTNTVKPKLDDAPRRLRNLKSEGIKTGPFNFDGNRYPNVAKRTPKHVPGGIFSNQLRDIAEAKARAARIAEAKRMKALKAEALKAAATKKKTIRRRRKRAKK